MSNSISSRNVVSAASNAKAKAGTKTTQKNPNKGIKIVHDRMDAQKKVAPAKPAPGAKSLGQR